MSTTVDRVVVYSLLAALAAASAALVTFLVLGFR